MKTVRQQAFYPVFSLNIATVVFIIILSRDLHIAQGTARTHIENIYRKLDVHKQQELIDLVENHEG